MPELWIPYGAVETLITIQAENLGAVSETPTAGAPLETERMAELAKGSQQLFVCDAMPPTLDALKALVGAMREPPLRIISSAPKRIEAAVPELKGKITTLPPPLPGGDADAVVLSPELSNPGRKLLLGTARPDPFFGLMDPKVEACLSWVANGRKSFARASKSMEPTPFQKTEKYDAVEALTDTFSEAKFLTIIPREGKAGTSLEDAPFDALKNAFPKVQMPQTKGIVIGVGGKGYDDTLSSALRSAWSAIEGVKKTGSILLVAECSEGVGSSALELLVTGRMEEGDRKRDRYVEGIEEVFYLNKMIAEYDVLLLSGLPETYARSKLGLATAKGSGEAVGRVLNKVGRTGKLNVVPRAVECRIESG